MHSQNKLFVEHRDASAIPVMDFGDCSKSSLFRKWLTVNLFSLNGDCWLDLLFAGHLYDNLNCRLKIFAVAGDPIMIEPTIDNYLGY